jgi:hypothetical protein
MSSELVSNRGAVEDAHALVPGQPGLLARRPGDLLLDRARLARSDEIDLPFAAIDRLGSRQEIARRCPDQGIQRDCQMGCRRRIGQDEAAVVILHRERDREVDRRSARASLRAPAAMVARAHRLAAAPARRRIARNLPWALPPSSLLARPFLSDAAYRAKTDRGPI